MSQFELSDPKGLTISVDAFFKDKTLTMWLPLGAVSRPGAVYRAG